MFLKNIRSRFKFPHLQRYKKEKRKKKKKRFKKGVGITLIMWKKSPSDGKLYPPEKLLSFICFTEKHIREFPPPPKKRFSR